MAEITMDVPGVLEAASRLRANIKSQAVTTKHDFHGVHVLGGALGSTPGARAFVAQHQAAQELYDKTIQQVIDDIENIAAALVKSADTMGDTEEAVRRALTALDPTKLAPQTRINFDQSVISNATALDPGDVADHAAKAAARATPVPAPVQAGPRGEAEFE